MTVIMALSTTRGESGESHPAVVATHVITVRYLIRIGHSSRHYSTSTSNSSINSSRAVLTIRLPLLLLQKKREKSTLLPHAPPSFQTSHFQTCSRNIREAMKSTRIKWGVGERESCCQWPRLLHPLPPSPEFLLFFFLFFSIILLHFKNYY